MENIIDKLKQYNQEHLLTFYNELTKEEKEKLLNQISKIDFEQMKQLYLKTKEKPEIEECSIEPLEYIDKYKLSKEKYNEYYNAGMQAIKQGKYAVVTMAGGQGTRLGHDGPKGTFDIGLASHKPIFEILCDTLKRAVKKFNVVIPWYIMTSKENHKETTEFFNKNNYFGYGAENIRFFKQGELPMLGLNGEILMDSKSHIKEAADGHGGIFEAMLKNNILEDMKQRGVEWIYIGGVDNVLAKLVDAFFVGTAIQEKKVSAGKSVIKANPQEKVGVFCKRNNKPSVIEYTEISEELANKLNDSGELMFGESHILCNLFNISVLEKLNKQKLPYHVAFKKAKYLNSEGEMVEPTEPNAYKFESFIFDAFGDIDNMIIVRGKREEEFAPVKNKDGVDSPETARKLYEAYWEGNK